MKITQTNNDQLDIKESGIPNLIAGGVLAVVGIGVSLIPLIGSGTPWWVTLIGLALIGFGALLVFTATSKTFVLRRTGASEITEKKLIGGKSATATFDASQVVSVGLETATEYRNTSSESGTSSQRERVSTLYILLRDNSEIVIGTSRNAGGGLALNGVQLGSFGKAPLSKEAQQIADLFGVQLNSRNRGETSLQDVSNFVGAVKNGLAGMPQSPTMPLSQTPILPVQPQQPATFPLPSQTQAPVAPMPLPAQQAPVAPVAPVAPMVASPTPQQPVPAQDQTTLPPQS